MTELSYMTKPRIALMGEFSAGKSTLANFLLEQGQSPVQVTATQVPPVWYSHGAPGAHRVTWAGEREVVLGDDWTRASPAETQLIEVGLDAEILETADLIDLPGTSDPNLKVQSWDTIVPQVDIAVWCTPANQAWRQSEAALWERVPDALRDHSLLLVTRMDKIRSATDKIRILERVASEAGEMFHRVLPISLTEALAAPTSDVALEASGAADMIRFLIQALEHVGSTNRPAFQPHILAPVAPEDRPPCARAASSPGLVRPRRVIRRRRPLDPVPPV